MNNVNIIGRLTTAPHKTKDDKRILFVQTKQVSGYDREITEYTTHKVIVYRRYVPIVDAFGVHLYDIAIQGHLKNGVVIADEVIAL